MSLTNLQTADEPKETRPEPSSVQQVRALFLGERIDVRAFEATRRLATSPLLAPSGDQGCVAIFRYGAVVLFDLSPVEEASFLVQLRPFLRSPVAAPDNEDARLGVDPDRPEGVENGAIILRDSGVERLQVVASILAKSVVLAHYEAGIAEAFDRIEPIAVRLKQGLGSGRRDANLVRHIGDALLIQHNMVGRVEITEKPEILWERPELDRLYLRLEDEYELRERHAALDRKLELIARTAETLLGLLHAKRSLRLEWCVVLLILFEIILSLVSMAFK